jgi:hypothetical protein
MGKPYSMDLCERVVAAIEGGESMHQAAARFAIGIATAGVWARLKPSTGTFVLPNRASRRGPCWMLMRISFCAHLQRRPTQLLTRWSRGCGRSAA